MEYEKVFKDEDGSYYTTPDGDKATIEEIIEYEKLTNQLK